MPLNLTGPDGSLSLKKEDVIFFNGDLHLVHSAGERWIRVHRRCNEDVSPRTWVYQPDLRIPPYGAYFHLENTRHESSTFWRWFNQYGNAKRTNGEGCGLFVIPPKDMKACEHIIRATYHTAPQLDDQYEVRGLFRRSLTVDYHVLLAERVLAYLEGGPQGLAKVLRIKDKPEALARDVAFDGKDHITAVALSFLSPVAKGYLEGHGFCEKTSTFGEWHLEPEPWVKEQLLTDGYL